ncbi:hypothetical protein ACET3Z_026849 [Daucus carota]
MALTLASHIVGINKLRPPSYFHSSYSSLHLTKPPTFFHFPSSTKTFRIFCQTDPNQDDDSSTPQDELAVEVSEDKDDKNSSNESASTSGFEFPQYPTKTFNTGLAFVSVVAAVGLFLSGRLDLGVSLKDISAVALPYEQALSNGKPTVVEFYADWCEVCRELAPDVYKVEQQYKDRVNFVMLNVDNTKWEQELDEFGVEGIPHFAFLDKKGNEEGNVVGRLPTKYLLENVDALAQGKESVPHARVVGQYSSAEGRKVHQVSDPRSHG